MSDHMEAKGQWWMGPYSCFWPLGESEREELKQRTENPAYELKVGYYLQPDGASKPTNKLLLVGEFYPSWFSDPNKPLGHPHEFKGEYVRMHKLTHVVWKHIFQRDDVYLPTAHNSTEEVDIFGETFLMGMSIDTGSPLDPHTKVMNFAQRITHNILDSDNNRPSLWMFRRGEIWSLGCQMHGKPFDKRWINFWEYNAGNYSWSKRLPEALRILGIKEEQAKQLTKQAPELNDKSLLSGAKKKNIDQIADVDSEKEIQHTSLTKEESDIHADHFQSSLINPSVVGGKEQQEQLEQARVGKNIAQGAEKNVSDYTISNVLGNQVHIQISGDDHELSQSSQEISMFSSESPKAAPEKAAQQEIGNAVKNATNKHLGNHGSGSKPVHQKQKSEVEVQVNVVTDWNRDDEKIRQNSQQIIESILHLSVQDHNTELSGLTSRSEQKLGQQKNVVIRTNPGNSGNQSSNRIKLTPPQAQVENTFRKNADGHVGAASSNVQPLPAGPPSPPKKLGKAGPNPGTHSRSGTKPPPQLSNRESPPQPQKPSQQMKLGGTDPSVNDNGKKIKLSTEQERELDKIQANMESPKKKTEIDGKTGSSQPKTSLRGGNPSPPVAAGSTESKTSVCARTELFVDSCSTGQLVAGGIVAIFTTYICIHCPLASM